MKKLTLVVGALVACAGERQPEAPLPDVDEAAVYAGQESLGAPAVVRVSAHSGSKSSSCTGAVISPHVVLTAAHCVNKGEMGSLDAYAPGEVSVQLTPRADDEALVAEAVHVAPGYELRSLDAAGIFLDVVTGTTNSAFNDVALIVVSEPLPVLPVPMLTEAVPFAAFGALVMRRVGYGRTSRGASDGGIKREGFTRLLRQIEDKGRINYVTDNTIGGSCKGDSGGPVFIEWAGKECIVGVNSMGYTGGKLWDDLTCGTHATMPSLAPLAGWLHDIIDAVDPGFREAGAFDDFTHMTTTFSRTILAIKPHHYTIPNVAPGTTVKVEMNGTGPMDLYVRVGAVPTNTEFDCRPSEWGGDEACTVTTPNNGKASTVYVSISGAGYYTLDAGWADAAYPATLP